MYILFWFPLSILGFWMVQLFGAKVMIDTLFAWQVLCGLAIVSLDN